MTSQTPTPRNAYSPRLQVLSPKGHTPAQQQFKQDCDINTIMKRASKNQTLDHISTHQPEYGFTSPNSYHKSLNLIAKADSMFSDLPSTLRNEFQNSPSKFLEFVQDPKNLDRAKELGLMLSDKAIASLELNTTPELPGATKPSEGGGSPQDAGTPPKDENPST